MSAPQRRASAKRRQSPEPNAGPKVPLDEQVCRTIIGVLFTLVRAKVDKHLVLQVVTKALSLMPDEKTLTAPHPATRVLDVAHLLTVWRSQSPYLDDRGQPRLLYARGRAPSIESLVREVAPNLDLSAAMEVLHASNAIEKVGRRYRPTTGLVRTRGSAYQASQHLHVLDAVTSNFEHNAAPKVMWPSWRAQGAESLRFPIRHLPELNDYIFEQSEQQLKDYDAFMRRYERAAKPNEPTTRAGVQILQYETSRREESPEFAETVDRVLRELGGSSEPTDPQQKTTAAARKSQSHRRSRA